MLQRWHGMLGLWLLAQVGALAAGENEVWYDAQGKPAVVLPATRKPAEFVSQWDRQALEREKRAAARRQWLDGGRRSRRGGEVYDVDLGYVSWGPVFALPYYYPVPRCPVPVVDPWRASWSGSASWGALRVGFQIRY